MVAECKETYKECIAAHDARYREVIATRAPWETETDLATRAGCSRSTITRLLQSASPDAKCNSEPEPAEPHTPQQPWEEQPEIIALHKAFSRCDPEQRGYVWKHVLPLYDPGTQYKRMIL